MIVTEPRCWIVFQAKEEFDDEYRLRDWLAGTIKKDRSGSYFLNGRFGVSQGSVLLFERNGFVVGSAIAREPIRMPTDEEKVHAGTFTFVLKVVPDSIWIWKEPFVSLEDLRAKGLDIPKGGGPQKEISASDVLKVFKIVCQADVG